MLRELCGASMNGNSTWRLTDSERVFEKASDDRRVDVELPLVVLLRVRNEQLILADTLDHIGEFADLIVAYEDASNDRTRDILRAHPKVGLIIENDLWLSGVEDRLASETRHRGLLLQEARARWSFRWCMCCDADERYVGDIRGFVGNEVTPAYPDAIRISLFDAYMTAADHSPYPEEGGQKLIGFRQFFGPECRNILMLWRNSDAIQFKGLDAREPCLSDGMTTETRFYCQHYGKSLSIEHWEATCDYYVNHFPYDPYGKKWQARRGKAIHETSDFDRKLFRWGDELFDNAVINF